MLEILSHQYLKRFVRSHRTDWDHIYSFGRIISKCLQANETYLINSEIFSTNNWLSALLISLFFVYWVYFRRVGPMGPCIVFLKKVDKKIRIFAFMRLYM